MTQNTRTFTVVDPTTFDGDCFEVAERAVRQAAAVVEVLGAMLPGVRSMVRNAEMERQLYATGECSAAEFDATALARKLDAAMASVDALSKALALTARASGYNPRNPPKA